MRPEHALSQRQALDTQRLAGWPLRRGPWERRGRRWGSRCGSRCPVGRWRKAAGASTQGAAVNADYQLGVDRHTTCSIGADGGSVRAGTIQRLVLAGRLVATTAAPPELPRILSESPPRHATAYHPCTAGGFVSLGRVMFPPYPGGVSRVLPGLPCSYRAPSGSPASRFPLVDRDP